MKGAYFFRSNFILEILDKWQFSLMNENFFHQLSVYSLLYLRTQHFWEKPTFICFLVSSPKVGLLILTRFMILERKNK